MIIRSIGFLDIVGLLLSAASILIALIDEKNRLFVLFGTSVLILIIGVAKGYGEISSIRAEQHKQGDRFNIYKDLIDIKVAIQRLQEARKP